MTNNPPLPLDDELIARQIIEKSIGRLRDLHEYAGRPAWAQVIADEIRAALQSKDAEILALRGVLDEAFDLLGGVDGASELRGKILELSLSYTEGEGVVTNPSLSEAVERIERDLKWCEENGYHSFAPSVSISDLRTILQSLSVGEEKIADAIQKEAQENGADSPVDRGDAERLARAVLDTMGMAR